MPGSPAAAEREEQKERGADHGTAPPLLPALSPLGGFSGRWRIEERQGTSESELLEGARERYSKKEHKGRGIGTHILEDFELQGRGIQVVEFPCNSGARVRERAHRLPQDCAASGFTGSPSP